MFIFFQVDYNPLVEKRVRYRTMEGHMEIPNDENTQVPNIEKPWKSLYFRIRDGRFQWFASHCADEHPINDILLHDTKIIANKEDWTFRIQGGQDHADLLVKAPSNVFEKWRLVLLSQSQSDLIDAYVQPHKPVAPHYTKVRKQLNLTEKRHLINFLYFKLEDYFLHDRIKNNW